MNTLAKVLIEKQLKKLIGSKILNIIQKQFINLMIAWSKCRRKFKISYIVPKYQ